MKDKRGQILFIGIAIIIAVAAFFLFSTLNNDSGDSSKETITNKETTGKSSETIVSEPESSMSFFITSEGPGNGADLGGLLGADEYCQNLGDSIGIGGKTWKAYLSTKDVDARDRIGTGPWYNYEGIMIATDVNELHGENNLNKLTALNEKGEIVNGRGDSPNRHDILTGSQLDGTKFSGENDTTCGDWTSSSEGSARLGHHDRTGGGDYPESWNSAHGSRGCSQEDLQGTGGDGLFYCFAVESGENDETVESIPDKTFILTGENFKFVKDGVDNPDLIVNKGDLVRIEFSSTLGFHDWVVDKFGATEKVRETDGSTYIEFIADQEGTFEYYCSVGSHRAQGMKGNFIVQ